MYRSKPRKVILVEFNEITWRFVRPLCDQGKLPTFAKFLQEGAHGTPMALEQPPLLDPWIAWTTLYTGRPQEEHGVRFLEQPPETVHGPRIWELAAEGGRSVGVYGSIMSWPPRPVSGFWIPSTFSPTPAAFPADLEPIQHLNLSQTRSHTPVGQQGARAAVRPSLLALRRQGLKVSTACRLAWFLLRSKITGRRQWEKVSLQPLVNLDFFERLYARYRPDFATFHSNHVAHYMHRYWRSADPAPFLTKPSEDEVQRYGDAVEYGYRVADEALARIWKLADDNTVVIVASGLGQQPYVDETFREGREVARVRDVEQLLKITGLLGQCVATSMMAPQWNLEFTDDAALQRAEQVLGTAWVREPGNRLYAFDRVGNTINFNIAQKNLRPLDMDAKCVFPALGNREFKLRDLCAVQDATPKQGHHEQAGVLLMRGAGIPAGVEIDHCDNLDFVPTILHLLGLESPSYMRGRVLAEAVGSANASTATSGAH